MGSEKDTKKGKEVLQALRSFSTAEEVTEFIKAEEAAGDLEWCPLGGGENVGTVRSGSGPVQALTERLTNGVDAVLERGVYENQFEGTPQSPREAVNKLFGLSKGGYNSMSKTWVRDVAKNNIRVQMHEGRDKDHPVIEVHDQGIGQPPERFADTFLSLNQDNKVSKPYLIGKYGQGGSNTFEYCEYAIIISRHVDGGDIGWSIVRYNDRTDSEGETYTDGIFEYCVRGDGSMPSIDEKHNNGFIGSTVRLVEYDATDFSGILGPGDRTLYTVVHEMMFGSLFPIYLEDHRIERFNSYNGSPRRRTVVGSRYRLDKPAKDVDEAREFRSIDLGEFGTLRVKFWVLEQTKAVSQFVDRARPMIFTHHGQKHHVEDKRYFKKTGFTFLKDRIVLEVSGDDLSAKGKRIFSSTRDRLSQSDAYRVVKEELLESLSNDDVLERLNQKYKQKALNESSSEQEERAKTLLADLLQETDNSKDGGARADGGTKGGSGTKACGSGRRDPVKPRYDVPSFVEIDNSADPLEAKQGRTMLVRVKLDAVNDFERIEGGEIDIEWTEDLEEVLSYRNETALDMGWKTFQLEVADNAELGAQGKITVTCKLPATKLTDSRATMVVEPPKNGGSSAASYQAPEVHEVGEDDTDRRNALGWDDPEAVVQYEPDSDSPGDIFVAMFNKNIQSIRETNDTEQSMQRRDTQYAAYMAYFEMMRYKEMEDGSIVEPPEDYQNREKNRVAKMLMRSISEGMNPEELIA